VDIYSTFLQRAYDQIFQEVTLQNLPVTFMLDRGGITGPDGPTHHGNFDGTYLRVFPNLTVMAPGDASEIGPMLEFALAHAGPVSIRYPKDTAAVIDRPASSVQLGRAEILDHGGDGVLIVLGSLLTEALEAAKVLRSEGLEVGVINARFAKPLDTETILASARDSRFLVTVEESALMGGFGSAVLEAICDAGLSAARVVRLGIPDKFIEHGERRELLEELGLTAEGIARTCRRMAARLRLPRATSRRRVS
jgi:1-deoxy-D-xylulose-5-phosphate synthase